MGSLALLHNSKGSRIIIIIIIIIVIYNYFFITIVCCHQIVINNLTYMHYHAPPPPTGIQFHWGFAEIPYILMMCQYPVLDSTSDWSFCMWNLLQPIESTTQGSDTLFSNCMSVLVPQTSFFRETRLPVHVHISALLIFCAVADPQNSG